MSKYLNKHYRFKYREYDYWKISNKERIGRQVRNERMKDLILNTDYIDLKPYEIKQILRFIENKRNQYWKIMWEKLIEEQEQTIRLSKQDLFDLFK